MDLKHIQEREANFSRRKFPQVAGNLDHDFKGLVGELGEFANKIKKLERGDFQMTPEFLFDLGMELADLQIYLVCLANDIEIDLDDFYQYVALRNEGRWPDASSTDQSDIQSVVQQHQQGSSGAGAFVAEEAVLTVLPEPPGGQLQDS
jgi:NTP pyrophosphatase (non-canonical NTP hydrolase)